MTYCRAARQLVEKEKYSEIRQLLKCVSESGVAAKSDGDTILLNCLEAFKRIPPQARSLPYLLAPPSISVSSHPRLYCSVSHNVPETLQDPFIILNPSAIMASPQLTLPCKENLWRWCLYPGWLSTSHCVNLFAPGSVCGVELLPTIVEEVRVGQQMTFEACYLQNCPPMVAFWSEQNHIHLWRPWTGLLGTVLLPKFWSLVLWLNFLSCS